MIGLLSQVSQIFFDRPGQSFNAFFDCFLIVLNEAESQMIESAVASGEKTKIARRKYYFFGQGELQQIAVIASCRQSEPDE